MRHLYSGLLFCVFLSGLHSVGSAQTPTRPAGQDLQIELTKAVKSKNAKVGDVVTAVTDTRVTLASGVVIPAASKVAGHVRKVEADFGAGHTSLISLSFDEIELKKGQTVPLNCFVRAALLPATKGTYARDNQNGQSIAPIGTSNRDENVVVGNGKTGPGIGDVNNPVTPSSRPSEDNSSPVPVHNGEVFGMPGVELSFAPADRLSTFKSPRKNLELDEGLQLMLSVQQ